MLELLQEPTCTRVPDKNGVPACSLSLGSVTTESNDIDELAVAGKPVSSAEVPIDKQCTGALSLRRQQQSTAVRGHGQAAYAPPSLVVLFVLRADNVPQACSPVA